MKLKHFIFTVIANLILSFNLFAQDAENVEQVGRIYNYWDKAQDMVVVEELAYVITGLSALQIVDISDQENIRIVGYWDNTNNGKIVTVSGDYAYIIDDNSRLHIISVAEPEHPLLRFSIVIALYSDSNSLNTG